jgi:hypothetical protein
MLGAHPDLGHFVRLSFVIFIAVHIGCATAGRNRAPEWVSAAPQRGEVVEIFLADLPAEVPCDWSTLVAAGQTSTMDDEILALLNSDSSRWKVQDCGALLRTCAAGVTLRDHGLHRWADVWLRFCGHAARCRTRHNEMALLAERISQWQPPPLLAPLHEWLLIVERYAAHLHDHEPAVAAAIHHHRLLAREAAVDQCQLTVEYAQTVAGTALELMAGDKRAPRFIAGELARTDVDMATFLERLVPNSQAYRNLVLAYGRYRGLATDKAFHELSRKHQKLRRTHRKDHRHRQLANRLAAEGLLSRVPTGTGAIVFGAALEAALRNFQRMHHLTETGAVGPATLVALNVTAAAKAESLRKALAAYRRAVPPWESTFVLVQMPAAYLEYYVGGELRRHQRTALGRTVRDADGARPMATPVLNSTITAVIFNPEWHVPWSIATNELEPAIEKDPGYLARNHYRREVLGEERVRYIQSPGSHNALGRVKFHFANSHDVYLHDTPQKRLFKLPRRLISHGCVRVEQAVKVATLILNLDQGFNWERLKQVLKSGETTEYRLKTPIPVHLLYSTAAADSNGNLHFMPDVYSP